MRHGPGPCAVLLPPRTQGDCVIVSVRVARLGCDRDLAAPVRECWVSRGNASVSAATELLFIRNCKPLMRVIALTSGKTIQIAFAGLMVDAGFRTLPAADAEPLPEGDFQAPAGWNGKFKDVWAFEYRRCANPTD